MKYAIRFLCLLFVGVVVVSVAFVRWETPPKLDVQQPDTLPDTFAGFCKGEPVLYVTRENHHSFDYWSRMLDLPRRGAYNRLVEVEFSLDEVRSAYIQAAALLQGEWSTQYSYRVQTAFAQDLAAEITKTSDEEFIYPRDAYQPSVTPPKDGKLLGYRMHVRLWGRDAEIIWKMLKERFGEIIQPWNDAALWELTTLGPHAEIGPSVGESMEPVLPLDMKSSAYLQNERLYNQGKGEAP